MGKTSIEWTDHSVNPIRARNKATGKVGHFCEKISPGCGHCYSSEWNENRFGTGLPFLPVWRDSVEMFLDESKLHEVLRRKKPTKYFWCDMTDLFLDGHPDNWLDRCFATMALTPQHTHQVLTKRPVRMLAYLRMLEEEKDMNRWAIKAAEMVGREACPNILAERWDWPLRNVWLGVSVEDQQRADERIPLLLQTPAAVRFLSVEPLLGPVDLSSYLPCIKDHDTGLWFSELWMHPDEHPEISWIIVGGESGPSARPMHPQWARSLRDQCQAAGVAFFFKQWGEHVPSTMCGGPDKLPDTGQYSWPFGEDTTCMVRVGKKAAGNLLDGQEWQEFPQ